MTGYICIAMLEDPPYNLIVAVTASEPKDWCAELPLPSHLLCFEELNNPNLVFKQFIQRLKTDGITIKTNRAFPARPHEVIRVFNQVRDEAFNNQQAIKKAVGVENRERSYGLAEEMNVVLKKPAVNEHQRALTANVSTSTPSLATQQRKRIGKFTVQDGIADDTETGLMWLRFAHGQTWKNGTTVGDATNVNWNKAIKIAKQFNQQGGYAGHSDWRLPTIDELKTLIDRVKGESGNSIDKDVFPKNAPWFWSSSLYSGSSFNACFVDFSNGYGNCDSKGSRGAVRLVRG
jgi:hypothetical protein